MRVYVYCLLNPLISIMISAITTIFLVFYYSNTYDFIILGVLQVEVMTKRM